MFEKISQVLNNNKYQNKSTNILDSSYICWVADQVGKKYGFRARKVKHHTLEIIVSSSILATEIKIKSKAIISEINKKLKKPAIEKLQFYISSN